MFLGKFLQCVRDERIGLAESSISIPDVKRLRQYKQGATDRPGLRNCLSQRGPKR